MSLARRIVGLFGAALAAGAGLASAAGLIGAISAWLDVLNHFAPVWMVAGWIGAALARLALPGGRVRTAALLSAAAAVVFSGVPMAHEMVRTGREAAPPGNLTLVTLNRWWGVRDPAAQAVQVAMIRDSGADLVAMQEFNGFEEAARRDLGDLYPYQIFCGPQCDTAILSKRPFLTSGKETSPRWPAGSGFLWVRTTAPDGRPVTLATAHLYWPIPPWIQRGQRRHLAELVHELETDELILVGDFNLTPWSFAMRGLDPTLAPLTRRTHGLLTFPANFPLPYLALDQVFAAPAWKTVAIERLPRAASDHYPVRVVLKRGS
jgi:endonuclease/exonuclease/phosphatase (EEP) superfamily protein YafD